MRMLVSAYQATLSTLKNTAGEELQVSGTLVITKAKPNKLEGCDLSAHRFSVHVEVEIEITEPYVTQSGDPKKFPIEEQFF